MESARAGGERHLPEEEDAEKHQRHSCRPTFTLSPPPSSSSSSCSARWTPPQTESAGDHHPSVSGSCISPEKEFMFDKVVTPSDVGKLNRLVIPKQHAERYFPLDGSTNQNGLQLGFVDPSGKPWRFRYSYWNSSQSYVITKGWSRFVKEKRLRAGDTVSFWRGAGEGGRQMFFIDWRRLPDKQDLQNPSSFLSFSRAGVPWPPLISPPSTSAGGPNRHLGYSYQSAAAAAESNPYLCYKSMAVQLGIGSGGRVGDRVIDSFPVVNGSPLAKRVRLFGVNLDSSPEKVDPDGNVSVRSRLPPLAPPSLRLSAGGSEMVGLQMKELR
ncbi:unnamed protein product [Spirodela intermedia]|uniref:TF-B3 domain-containing protein n=1 Tax=Spirodela intermedia TaxID=51605 RepID=A0A7I8L1C6_SPIIN|nr:unnamed protein product [Spirodela intermedia]